MQKWEYTFPPTSKEDWIHQIEKDLKGKSIESLYSEWWPGEPLVPVHHSSDSAAEPIILPEQWFVSPPRIVEVVEIVETIEAENSSAKQINKVLLEALQFGTQTFLLHPDHRTATYVEEMLEGIFPDMVQWDIYNSADSNSMFESILKRSPQTAFLRIKRSVNQPELKSMLHVPNENLRFEYHFKSDENWIEEATRVFQLVLDDLKQWQDIGSAVSFFEKCVLKLDSDVHYFKHVIQSRVLQLLWLNLTCEYSFPINTPSSSLECHIKPKVGEKPEHYLIRASLSSLAAVLTGTSSLCIHHIEDASVPDFYKRIDRNIHHLLHLESGLPGGRDPLAGAYTLDYYTRNWTERIWKQLPEG